jgi:hypothetical protein
MSAVVPKPETRRSLDHFVGAGWQRGGRSLSLGPSVLRRAIRAALRQLHSMPAPFRNALSDCLSDNLGVSGRELVEGFP